MSLVGVTCGNDEVHKGREKVIKACNHGSSKLGEELDWATARKNLGLVEEGAGALDRQALRVLETWTWWQHSTAAAAGPLSS